ncbi:hypothetical protein DFJ74DRAFT_668855 [Hyaloraphidium curvatum]|nr:hypothetical protein DFJ74DRAFT_668855 [Hyaloraphidium curvatum]
MPSSSFATGEVPEALPYVDVAQMIMVFAGVLGIAFEAYRVAPPSPRANQSENARQLAEARRRACPRAVFVQHRGKPYCAVCPNYPCYNPNNGGPAAPAEVRSTSLLDHAASRNHDWFYQGWARYLRQWREACHRAGRTVLDVALLPGEAKRDVLSRMNMQFFGLQSSSPVPAGNSTSSGSSAVAQANGLTVGTPLESTVSDLAASPGSNTAVITELNNHLDVWQAEMERFAVVIDGFGEQWRLPFFSCDSLRGALGAMKSHGQEHFMKDMRKADGSFDVARTRCRAHFGGFSFEQYLALAIALLLLVEWRTPLWNLVADCITDIVCSWVGIVFRDGKPVPGPRDGDLEEMVQHLIAIVDLQQYHQTQFSTVFSHVVRAFSSFEARPVRYSATDQLELLEALLAPSGILDRQTWTLGRLGVFLGPNADPSLRQAFCICIAAKYVRGKVGRDFACGTCGHRRCKGYGTWICDDCRDGRPCKEAEKYCRRFAASQ